MATGGCAAPTLPGIFSASFKYPHTLEAPVLSCCWGPVAHALLFGAVPPRMDPVLAEDVMSGLGSFLYFASV